MHLQNVGNVISIHLFPTNYNIGLFYYEICAWFYFYICYSFPPYRTKHSYSLTIYVTEFCYY